MPQSTEKSSGENVFAEQGNPGYNGIIKPNAEGNSGGQRGKRILLGGKLWSEAPDTGEQGRGQAEGASGAGDVVTYRRVQGGSGTNSSQPRISIDDTNKILISKPDKNLNLSVDGGEHSQYFLSKRPGSGVVEFNVPKWFDDFVKEYEVPQAGYNSNPLNQGGTAPKITDITTPGKSIEFPSPWIEWIEEYATNGRFILEVK